MAFKREHIVFAARTRLAGSRPSPALSRTPGLGCSRHRAIEITIGSYLTDSGEKDQPHPMLHTRTSARFLPNS